MSLISVSAILRGVMIEDEQKNRNVLFLYKDQIRFAKLKNKLKNTTNRARVKWRKYFDAKTLSVCLRLRSFAIRTKLHRRNRKFIESLCTAEFSAVL